MKEVHYIDPSFLKAKGAWGNLSMKDKVAMMEVAVRNGITNLKEIRDKYNEFAEGGQKETWTMEDEAGYNEWRSNLPDNLRLTDDYIYDMRAAYKAGMQPTLESDGLYHLGSRDPETGRILKAPYHPTYLQAINTDARLGYYPIVDNKGNTYTNTWEGNKFEIGGPLVEHAFARNASKWKHAHGGELGNYYGGLGDFVNSLRQGVRKARQKVKDWGLDKDPIQHLQEFLTPTADRRYRQNLYNMVDPTSDVPDNPMDVAKYGLIAMAAKYGGEAPYIREKNDSVANAAWAKRLELDYNKNALIDNGDGTFRLPASNEAEMPVDTTFLKNRIADNQKLLNKVEGKRRSIIGLAIDEDTKALNALRKTYATGEPVEMSEESYVNRNWNVPSVEDIETSPLNVLHRYTMQYDKDNNRMKYWDWYDFNEFEDFVSGKPFKIQGSIDLNKKK